MIELVQFVVSLFAAIFICNVYKSASRIKLLLLHFFLVATVILFVDSQFRSQFSVLMTSNIPLPQATSWILVYFLWCCEVAIIPFLLVALFIKREVSIAQKTKLK